MASATNRMLTSHIWHIQSSVHLVRCSRKEMMMTKTSGNQLYLIRPYPKGRPRGMPHGLPVAVVKEAPMKQPTNGAGSSENALKRKAEALFALFPSTVSPFPAPPDSEWHPLHNVSYFSSAQILRIISSRTRRIEWPSRRKCSPFLVLLTPLNANGNSGFRSKVWSERCILFQVN